VNTAWPRHPYSSHLIKRRPGGGRVAKGSLPSAGVAWSKASMYACQRIGASHTCHPLDESPHQSLCVMPTASAYAICDLVAFCLVSDTQSFPRLTIPPGLRAEVGNSPTARIGASRRRGVLFSKPRAPLLPQRCCHL
jgi:hypothetical protein